MSPFENPSHAPHTSEVSSSIPMKHQGPEPLSAEGMMAIALAVVAFGFELVFFSMFMLGITQGK